MVLLLCKMSVLLIHRKKVIHQPRKAERELCLDVLNVAVLHMWCYIVLLIAIDASAARSLHRAIKHERLWNTVKHPLLYRERCRCRVTGTSESTKGFGRTFIIRLTANWHSERKSDASMSIHNILLYPKIP